MSIFTKKKTDNYWQYGIGSGIFVAIYCFFIAVLMLLADGFFAGPTVIGFLLLLIIMVLSAAVSGLLIFGYPLYLALQKQYQEAIFTLLLSITTLVIIGLIIIIIKLIF